MKDRGEPKTAAQLKKAWAQRRPGIMKKADEIRHIFNARVAVIIERQGVLYVYQSGKDFPDLLPGKVEDNNSMTPEDFVTPREYTSGSTPPEQQPQQLLQLDEGRKADVEPRQQPSPNATQRGWFDFNFDAVNEFGVGDMGVNNFFDSFK